MIGKPQFSVAFDLQPLMPLEEHAALLAKNKEAKAKMEILEKRLAKEFDNQIKNQNGDYESRTDADKSLVDEYNELKHSIVPLPQFYAMNVSARWAAGSAELTSANPKLKAEIEQAKSCLRGFFQYYPF